MVTDFWHESAKNAYPPSIWWDDRSMDARVNTADEPPTSGKYLVNVDSIISEFCRRDCAGRATWWALPRICLLLCRAGEHSQCVWSSTQYKHQPRVRRIRRYTDCSTRARTQVSSLHYQLLRVTSRLVSFLRDVKVEAHFYYLRLSMTGVLFRPVSVRLSVCSLAG